MGIEDDEFKLSGDDTLTHLETIAQTAGADTRYRLGMVYALKGLKREIHMGNVAIIARIARAEKAILTPGSVVRTVRTELKEDPRVGKLETEVKRLWWIIGILFVAIVGLAIARALK